MTTMPDVTPLKVEPGATYIVEVDRHITPDEAADLKSKLHDLTNADFVILTPGLRITKVRGEIGAATSKPEHDPLCGYRPDVAVDFGDWEMGSPCRCGFIAQVREDQRRQTWRDLSTMSMWEVALLLDHS